MRRKKHYEKRVVKSGKEEQERRIQRGKRKENIVTQKPGEKSASKGRERLLLSNGAKGSSRYGLEKVYGISKVQIIIAGRAFSVLELD